MKRYLCVCYSRTGTTKHFLKQFISRAKECNADVELDFLEISDGKNREGLAGYLKGCFEALSGKMVSLLPYGTGFPISEYDAVILGVPIWALDACPLAKSFLVQNAGKIKGKLYFVITHMGPMDYGDVAQKLTRYAGKKADGYVSVMTKKEDLEFEMRELLNLVGISEG